ncbi:MAG: peptidase M28 [Verrucomicrobia bacterium]|nr:MAG: peptidase M28 [Verrucomicrobiota bacterium]
MKKAPSLTIVWVELLVACFSLSGAETNAPGEAQFLSQIRQLTFEGRRSGEGYFSPDGRALVFQSEREPGNPFYQIYLLDLETGDSHRVSPGSGKTTCAFFRPNSDEVLFASTHLDSDAKAKQKTELDFRGSGKERRYSWDYDEHFDIFVAKHDGSRLRRLTSACGYDAEASYSPDGKKIVFTSLRDAYPAEKLSSKDRKRLQNDPAYFGEIYIMNADGSGQKRLTFTPGYDGGPFFSPDGRRILWRRFDTNGINADIYTMKLDGSDVRRLTDFGCMSWAPFYHPYGQYLVFTANKLGFANFELFIVDAAGDREPVRVTFTDGFDGLPVFSPDGKKLCWSSNRTMDGKSQLFLAAWDHPAALAALKASPERGAGAGVLPVWRLQERPGVEAHKQPPAPHVGGYAPEIRGEDLRSEVGYLASDALEGRLTGTKGAALAAEFIADQLRRANLKPFGQNGNYFQPFEFSSGVKVVTNGNQLILSTESGAASATFAVEKDFRPLSFTSNGEFEGEVVFAGYGLTAAGKAAEGYDSYTGLDVTNKIVLVLRYVPENVEPKRRQELNLYAALRYKALVARGHGAKAILVVTGPNSPNPGALVPLSSDGSLSGSDIIAASITTNVADALVAGSGKDLRSLQTALDSENPHAESGFVIPKVKVKVATAVERVRKTDRNVIAHLPPAGRRAAPAEYVLLGAHYDHLGRGESSSSRETAEETGQIHHGADDNASGVAAVLELAASLADEEEKKPDEFRHGVIVAFWSGEELGLLGSSYFAEHAPLGLSNIVAYLNFDMVGRLRDNKLILQGVGSSSEWRRLIEKRNIAVGFNLVLQDDPYVPTDTTALYPKQIPVLAFFTGSHDDYHRPTDVTDKLNFEGLERITRFARTLVLDLATASTRPDYVKVERSGGPGGRDALRAYLGTVPDYTTEVKGVKLSGVRGGSPAEKAGLKGSDIIIEFAGQKIANIYDYTYALDAVKIGQPVDIAVERDGRRVTLKVTPEARK